MKHDLMKKIREATTVEEIKAIIKELGNYSGQMSSKSYDDVFNFAVETAMALNKK